MLLANSTIDMLHYLSQDVVAPFMREELVGRIATMLNYFLVALAGPSRSELKVKNPESYNFKPKELLTKLIDIYLNFSKCEEFKIAITQDQRSYTHEVFLGAAKILRDRIPTYGEDKLVAFEIFVLSVQETALSQAKADEIAYTDVPDEFLDPIMSTLMTDPVYLPTSNMTVDRKVISRHLLGNDTDPFTKKPLTLEMLKPDVELKAKIESWLAEAKSKASS
eukprot:TRINITY_DN5160_c0_g2_i1.p1 TRINITY_DN5160_c0_g2~~TRINITY_DN5160_c0_g2_i1.p1  ORF type:complete len:247 (-),score=20.39 TRINITY_DN5160_c0_g2_i1:64-729(-)